MHYAFLDESGTVGPSTGSNFLVVAVLDINQPRIIELKIRRALKKHGRRLRNGEIKAARSEEPIILRMLHAIFEEEVSIVAVIVDQKAIFHPPMDKEDIYRHAVTRAIYHLVERFPRIIIYLDRRYINEHLRYSMVKQIREGIEELPQKLVLIRQENSLMRKELQAADSVAWAYFQKFERGDNRFYNVIASKVIKEELIVKKDWKDG